MSLMNRPIQPENAVKVGIRRRWPLASIRMQHEDNNRDVGTTASNEWWSKMNVGLLDMGQLIL